jgi:(S)-2-hydroxy-acid oxidase
VLRDVSDVDTSTTIFGRRYNFPIAIAPSAYQKLAGHGGEIDVAKASSALGTNYILSSNATTSLEDVMESLPPSHKDGVYPRPWFQLYFLRNRERTAALVQRAQAAGYEALVLTVDNAVMGNRLHERQRPLALPPHLQMANQASRKAGAVSRGRLLLNAATAAEARRIVAEHGDALVDSSLQWDEVIPWLRSKAPRMRIIVKGIMTGEDAQRAVETGVDAIIVSNHGGRSLDGGASTLEALIEVVEAVRHRVPVIVDGGISRGSDVFKALALGADLCLIGRSALWGLAYDGQQGVEAVLNILERELWRTMSLMGARSLGEISSSMLGRPKNDGFGIAKL